MKAMDHSTGNNQGGAFALASVLLYILGRIDIGIGDFASFLAVLSGASSLLINWPKIKKRVIEIAAKFKKKK